MVSTEYIEGKDVCPHCKGKHIFRDYESGELVCKDCGCIVDDLFIDQGPEWRNFGDGKGEDRSRVGDPRKVNIHDGGMSTEISSRNRDAYGRSIPASERAVMYRIRKWQKRIRIASATDRNLASAFSNMGRVVSAMSLPKNVEEAAAAIYRKAVKSNLIRGRSIEGVVAASIYAACRQCNVPRTLDEVADASSVSRKEIGRTYRYMRRQLKLNLMPTSPQDYVPRFCSELKVRGDVQIRTNEILRDAKELEITSGKGPTGVAAAAIYIATIQCNDRRTQRDVAEVAGVTEVTIRNRYKELTDKLGIAVQV